MRLEEMGLLTNEEIYEMTNHNFVKEDINEINGVMAAGAAAGGGAGAAGGAAAGAAAN